MPQPVDEQTFEQSIAELAVNTLKTKVPALMDYALAFQLVDRGEDDTNAVGFFGFKVGEALLYVPIIFRNGEIKGTELCYVVDEDRFVPLSDDWVNQLIRRKTFTIGSPAGKNRQQQGVTGPDLRRLRVPPTEAKIGEDLSLESGANWARFGIKMFDSVLERATEKVAGCPLPEFLAKRGITVQFLEDAKGNPKLASAVFAMYSPEDFLAAMESQEKTAKSKITSSKSGLGGAGAPSVYKRDVQIFSGDDALNNPAEMESLSEAEKKQVLNGNVVVKDGRPEAKKRKVYDTDMTKRLTNPTDGGLYDVITESGEIAKLWVLIPKVIGSGGTRDLRFVLNGKGEYMLTPKTTIWTTKQYVLTEVLEELAKFGDLLKSKDSWDTDSANGFVIVDARGQYAVGPFTVDTVIENEDGTTTLLVEQQRPRLEGTKDRVVSGAPRERTGMPFDGALFTDDGVVNLSNGDHDANQPYKGYSGTYDNVRKVVLTDKPIKNPVVSNGVVLVPRNGEFRVIKLGDQMRLSSSPGSSADLYLQIGKFAEAVDTMYDGHLFRIETGKGMRAVSTIKEAYEVLCREVGISGDDAREIIEAVQDHPWKKHASFVQKIAAMPFDSPDFQAAHDPIYDAPVQQGGISTTNLLPEHASFDPGSAQVYRPQKDDNVNKYQNMYDGDVKNLNKATELGQKDVFDASAISALVNVNDPSDEIEDYLPDFMRCLDKLGRVMFMFYWHGEELQERYGKTEAKNLEDDVRNVFENLGDTVLDLKKSSPNTDDLFGSGIIGGGGTGSAN